jgi:hypothetical protein
MRRIGYRRGGGRNIETRLDLHFSTVRAELVIGAGQSV